MSPNGDPALGLEARDVSVRWGKQRVLHGVSLLVKPGESVAILGANGSGKSTLLRVLAFLQQPVQGWVRCDSVTRSADEWNEALPTGVWPTVTMVFQQLFLWPHLTLLENARLPLRHLSEHKFRARVDPLIEQFALANEMRRFPNQVSVGQRQRGALIRALALEPRYLLLDEATASLDVEQSELLLEHLQHIQSQGTALVFVTHLIGFAKRCADRVVFLREGLVEEAGGPEVLSNPRSVALQRFLSLVE